MTFAGVVKWQPQRAQNACSFVSPGGSTPLARTVFTLYLPCICRVAPEWLERADTRDLKSRAFGREGSTPFSGTIDTENRFSVQIAGVAEWQTPGA